MTYHPSPPTDARRASVGIVVLLDLLLRDVFQSDLLAGLQPGKDLDALECRDAGRHGHDIEVILPVVREPDELVAGGKGLLGRGELLRLQAVLQPVSNRLSLALLKSLERDRDRLRTPPAQD